MLMRETIYDETLRTSNEPFGPFMKTQRWNKGFRIMDCVGLLVPRLLGVGGCVNYYRVILKTDSQNIVALGGLRIVYTMRYNRINGTTNPSKTSACGARDTARRLTQPTGTSGELGWLRFYHRPDPNALGGTHQGVLRCRAGQQPGCPTNRRSA